MTEVRAELHDAFATVAVTGTNGKTTTTSMVDAIVGAAGEHHARVTTLGAWLDDELLANGATLEAFALAVERGAAAGIRTLALEITSRALSQGFARRWPAQVAVFTNLSRDHLDYHGDPEHYLAAKAQLFLTLLPGGAAVLNACDPSSALIAEVTPPEVARLGFAASRSLVAAECGALPRTLVARSALASRSGTRIELEPSPLADVLGGRIELRVIGDLHAENALAAALAAHALGYAPEAIRRGLAEFQGVPGRFEPVWRDPMVVVDYAHTPDALQRTLELARELAGDAALGCVFGCGGGTDPGKRPEMGRVAAALCDHLFVTSDNPRYEDPAAIAAGVLVGVREGSAPSRRRPASTAVELDRRAAIRRAIAIARPGRGDIVVIAGKGHETTQKVGDSSEPFDDSEVARAACRDRFESEEGG
jgi:UDP-N-acetylmuramoyl-L-alanyl-D-glutamate--2,6-diaminopimelate ligase